MSATAGHSVEDCVLGVKIGNRPEGASFERSSQSLAEAHGHDARMLAPSVARSLPRCRRPLTVAPQELGGDEPSHSHGERPLA